MSERELNEDGTYTVQGGDTLWAIAESFLGDGNRWREVYDANTDTIGDNPDVIQPDQVLVLPAADAAPADEAPAEDGAG
jgi:nucleoid-associated protein YgaU